MAKYKHLSMDERILIQHMLGQAAAICLLSAKTRSYIMTIAISIGLIIVPLLLYVSGIDFMKYALCNPLLLGNIF